jgi:polysaccharide pyruvyl transferase WcaK-like protein
MPERDKTLLHINADPRIYSINSLLKVKRLAQEKNALFITNRAPEKDFVSCLAKSSHIITSSYHGAYWGLLSGRTVTLMGYSFKFKSLLNILNLKENFIPFKKGDQKTLLQATNKAFDQSVVHKLENHTEILSQFRGKQLDFANMLENKKILKQCKVKTFNSNTITSEQKSEIIALSKYYTIVGLRNLKAKIKP